MAKAEQPKSPKKRHNATAKKTAVKKEVKEPEIQLPKIYYIPLFFKQEPYAKDVHVADYIYKEAINELSFFEINPAYSSDLEGLMEGDISVVDSKGSTTMVSRHEQTFDWIKNLSLAKEFSGNPYYAGTPLEDTDTNETG